MSNLVPYIQGTTTISLLGVSLSISGDLICHWIMLINFNFSKPMVKIENEAIKEKAETVINSSKHLKHIEKLNAKYGTN